MDKYVYNKNYSKLTYGRGYVYSLQYHIVWCTKYRKKVLFNGIDDDIKGYLNELAKEYSFSILAMEVMPDHIHILVDCKPQFFPSDMIKILKGNTARWLFMKHPELKKQLWGGHLWNPSYCIVTVSDRSFEQVKHYIDSQKER
jgi:putative transposase